jgi:pyruvate dehydrogenase E2 component (dihydrolipoamide acetyltransferase)/2-oxoisovalerate dehydrogenase E2 component (dihydrolipoyl transacylase)
MDFLLPELGEGVYEAEMTRWLVKAGDVVKPGQALLEVLTDKATMEVPAPFAGKITALKVQPGDKLMIGQAILAYEGKAGTAAATAPAAKAASKAAAAPTAPVPTRNGPMTADAGTIQAAPAVRQMARKLGIDLAKVHGSGAHGRILIDDLAIPASVAAPKPAEPPPDFGTGQRVKLVGLRRKIAEHMVQSKRIIPHYTYVDECDVTELVKLRDQKKAEFSRQGAKLTYLAFFVKAVALALKEVPAVNASLDDAAGEIVLHDHVNIGLAVATPAGLIVPVIHDADARSLLDLAREVERLSADARAGKSKREDVHGGTFSVTSIGNLGGLFATPVINYPEAGILGVGKIVKRPIFDDQGQVRAADMVYLSLAFDHRVVDGAVAVEFGNSIIKLLQKPSDLATD